MCISSFTPPLSEAYADVPGAASNESKYSHLRVADTAVAPVICADSNVKCVAFVMAETLIERPLRTTMSPTVNSVFAAEPEPTTAAEDAATVNVPVKVDSQTALDGQVETFNEFPKAPAYLATHGPTLPEPVEYELSYTSSFLTKSPVPVFAEPVVNSAVELSALAVTARTTYNAGL